MTRETGDHVGSYALIVQRKLQAIMKEKGWSERALARELGVSPPTIHRAVSTGSYGRALESALLREFKWTPEQDIEGDGIATLVRVLGRSTANRVRAEFLDPQALTVAHVCDDIMAEAEDTGETIDPEDAWERVKAALIERPELIAKRTRLVLAASKQEPSKASRRRDERRARKSRDEESSGTRLSERGNRVKKAE